MKGRRRDAYRLRERRHAASETLAASGRTACASADEVHHRYRVNAVRLAAAIAEERRPVDVAAEIESLTDPLARDGCDGHRRAKPTSKETTMAKTSAQASRQLASALLLAGAVLLFIGNTAHPVDVDSSATSRLALARSASWMPIHLTIAAGVVAVVGALAVLPQAIAQPVGAAYARLAAVAAVVGGTALVLVFGALDGYGQAVLAGAWAGASGAERAAIETVALALDTIDSGMTAIGILALFGAAMAALGAAIVASRVVGRWLGWAAVVIGLAGTVTGVLFAILGSTPLVINGLFRPVAMAATLYFVVLAVALRRQPRRSRPTGQDVALQGLEHPGS